MTLEDALTDLTGRIVAVSPSAVIRIQRAGSEEATIRAYAAAEYEQQLKDAVRDQVISLLTEQSIDVQVLVYDIATSLPPDA